MSHVKNGSTVATFILREEINGQDMHVQYGVNSLIHAFLAAREIHAVLRT
jgi:hypothetical protein